MANIPNSAKKHYADRTAYGGTIYLSDFYTNYNARNNYHGSAIAARIISDWNFDRCCRLNGQKLKQNI